MRALSLEYDGRKDALHRTIRQNRFFDCASDTTSTAILNPAPFEAATSATINAYPDYLVGVDVLSKLPKLEQGRIADQSIRTLLIWVKVSNKFQTLIKVSYLRIRNVGLKSSIPTNRSVTKINGQPFVTLDIELEINGKGTQKPVKLPTHVAKLFQRRAFAPLVQLNPDLYLRHGKPFRFVSGASYTTDESR